MPPFKLDYNRIGDTYFRSPLQLLKITNGYLHRVRLEYYRVQGELNSLKADLNNTARVYQQFNDRIIEMNKRVNELQQIINELEVREAELRKTATEQQQFTELQENNIDNVNLIPEIKQENVISANNVSAPQTDTPINYYHNENEMQAQIEPSSAKLIFDPKVLFQGRAPSKIHKNKVASQIFFYNAYS
jgi:TolA-binding protein